MKRSGYLAIILGGILLGSQILLPLAAETMITRSLKRSISASEINADIDAFPALTILGGSADEITLTGRDVLIGRLLCSEATATFSDVRIDTGHLMDDGKLLFQRLGHAEASAWVTEEELARTLEESVEKLSNVSVTVTPSGIEAQGNYAFGKLPARIALTGQIIGRGDKIVFVSEQVTLQHTAIGKLSANLKTDVELADLGTLPFAVRITDIRPTDGRILLAIEKTTMQENDQ